MNVDVVVEELAQDWVMIRPALSEFRREVELERLPGLINQTLVAWLRSRPGARVQSTLALVEGGSTVAVHVWLDATESAQVR